MNTAHGAAPARIVKVQGGLGNQLFCLAMAHSVARVTGESVGLDVASYRADRYGQGFELAPLAKDLGLAITPAGLIGTRAGAWLARRLGGRGVVGDGATPQGEKALRALAMRGRAFVGYWQDEAWIADAPAFADAARRLIAARAPAAPATDLAVHWRSYAEEVRPSRRATPDEAYFRAAYERVVAARGAPGDILLVSDRPDLARGRIGSAFTPTDGRAADKWADLAAVIAARALILTNSSFSWWGGFLSQASPILWPRRGGLFHYPAPAERFEVV